MKRVLLVSLIVVVAAIVAFYLFRREVPPPEPEPYAEPDTVKPTRVAILYFGSTDGASLAGEVRELPVQRFHVEGLLEELLRGSFERNVRTIPEGTRLLDVFDAGRSTYYLDFSKELDDFELKGFSSERLLIASILRTLDANLDYVGRVCILIEGLPRETLSGHVAIRGSLECDLWSRLLPTREGETRSTYESH